MVVLDHWEELLDRESNWYPWFGPGTFRASLEGQVQNPDRAVPDALVHIQSTIQIQVVPSRSTVFSGNGKDF